MKIGIDLGGTKIEGIVQTPNGEIERKLRIDTPQDNYADIVIAVSSVVKELQQHYQNRLSVGIGTPGALEKDSQVMKNCNSISLNGYPLKKDLESALGYEIRIENDANCLVLSEAQFGAGKDADIVFGVIIGTGTGGALVIDRKLINGPNGISGEWGHNSIPASMLALTSNKRECYCGRQDCIETYLSGRGLKQTHLELTGIEMAAIEIFRNQSEGDADCRASIDRYTQQLARCLATIINTIDPDVVVFGGGLSNIESLYQRLPEYILPYVFNDQVKTKFLPALFGDASGARGAAGLWS